MAISFVGSLPTVAVTNGGNVTLTFSNLRDAAGVQPTLAQNDVVFALFGFGNTADYTAPTITGWTLLDDKYANGSTNDTNLMVYYKRMTASPDTSVTCTGPTGSANSSIGVAFALRGVDTTTVIDTYTSGTHSTTGTGSGAINPLTITPSASGSWIVVTGALANPAGAALTDGGDLSTTTNHYRSGTSPDTNDISIGVGLKINWVSGAFDPAAWAGGGTRAAGDSWAAMTFSVKPLPETQTLTPSLFTNSQTFYAPQVNLTLLPNLYTSSQTFYSPTVSPGSVTLTPDLFTNSQTFYSGTVSHIIALTPDLYTNTQTFYSPTVTPGQVTLTPSLYTNTQTFYAPTVTRGTVTLTPDLFTSSQTFYAPTVVPGVRTLTPSLFTDSQTFYSPTISTIDISYLTPSLFTNTQTFYSPTVAVITPLFPDLFNNTQTFYSPTISVGPVTLTPSPFVNINTFYDIDVEKKKIFGKFGRGSPYLQSERVVRARIDRG